jgi:two-component system, chemotaxis family, chemotaxis protein CheY
LLWILGEEFVSYRILIVEESAAARELMAAALRSVEGVEVVSVPSGFEALRLLPRQHFDLIVTDAEMPDIDGFELVNFVKKSPPYRSTPLVMVSDHKGEAARARGMSMGASEYLVKPFAAVDLADVVRRHLPEEALAV